MICTEVCKQFFFANMSLREEISFTVPVPDGQARTPHPYPIIYQETQRRSHLSPEAYHETQPEVATSSTGNFPRQFPLELAAPTHLSDDDRELYHDNREAESQPTHQGSIDEGKSLERTETRHGRCACGLPLWAITFMVLVVSAAAIGGFVGLGVKLYNLNGVPRASVSQSPVIGEPSGTTPITTDALKTISGGESILSNTPFTASTSTASIVLTTTKSLNESASSPTSTSTPSLKFAREQFKFQSIAASNSGPVPHLHVAYLQNGKLKLNVRGNTGWKPLGDLSPPIPLKKGTPITVISFRAANIDQTKIRIYYFSTANRLVEFCGSCSGDGTVCRFTSASALLKSGIHPSSGLAAVYWSKDGHNLRVFYQDDHGMLQYMEYGSSTWYAGTDPPEGKVMAGSAMTATVVERKRGTFFIRLCYRGDDKALVEIQSDTNTVGWTEPVLVPITNDATFPQDAALASSAYLTNTSSIMKPVLNMYLVDAKKRPMEITSEDDSFENPPPCRRPDVWVAGDDIGGAIAGIGWLKDDGVEERRFYYALGGSLQEIVRERDEWVKGEILKS
ncbi:hypothetical protein P154DRAFT_606350 [Amniculicola lignicola CBS 123094]|uniref:Uncharacterized protein n=1 Tax=Amniculicola lignicola CBS 123094 TaxID=1392246 RepID=A0A6A5WW37_9PLEO|nr:hypothetical protein P154DRAFT_606350 [Amniculicola lignicola CBS 123094]